MLRFFPAVALAAVAVPALSQQGAHVHGSARMNLALEGNALAVDLFMPAHDVVGFEHAPADEADRAAVAEARVILENGSAVLGLPDEARCALESAAVHSALLEPEGHDDEHAEKEDDHADHEGEGGEMHSEFRVEYRFACSAPEALTSLRLGLFKSFPRVEQVTVQGITETGQISVRLTADAPRLRLSD